MISIITINLNNALGLRKTRDSLLNQSDYSFEWVIVDGGSTDGSLDELNSELPFKSIVLIGEDTGLYNAMNLGIRSCSDGSEYMLFLNSGDILYDSDSVSSIVDASKVYPHSDLLLFGFCYNEILRFPRPIWWKLWSLPTSHQAIIYKSSVMASNFFLERFRFASDYEHFLRLCDQDYLSTAIHKILISNDDYGSNSWIDLVMDEYDHSRKMYYPYILSSIVSVLKRIHTSMVHRRSLFIFNI